jgi:hypothetical protein
VKAFWQALLQIAGSLGDRTLAAQAFHFGARLIRQCPLTVLKEPIGHRCDEAYQGDGKNESNKQS